MKHLAPKRWGLYQKHNSRRKVNGLADGRRKPTSGNKQNDESHKEESGPLTQIEATWQKKSRAPSVSRRWIGSVRHGRGKLTKAQCKDRRTRKGHNRTENRNMWRQQGPLKGWRARGSAGSSHKTGEEGTAVVLKGNGTQGTSGGEKGKNITTGEFPESATTNNKRPP